MKPEDIKTHRKNRGLTQEQLASMMQVDSTTIYRWENGIVAPSLAKSTILRDILVKAGDGLTHPFVDHLISRDMATAVLDFHGVYHRVNKEYERLIGMPRIQLLENRAWEILDHLADLIVEKGSVDLDKIVQGKIACIRAKNLLQPETGKRLDHELHVVSQRDFSTIIVHETVRSLGSVTSPHVEVEPRY